MYNFNRLLPTNPDNAENMFTQPYLHWEKCADDDTILKFIEYGESLPTTDARIGNNTEDARLSESVRISKLSWIHHTDESKELFDFIIDKIDRVNYHHWGMHLNAMESMQYTRYPINGHYAFHHDITRRQDKLSRKLSFVLSLSDKEDYTGGDFLLMPHGANPTRFKFNKGDLLAFPSWVPHKVEPVIVGNRITVVAWAIGPKFI